MFSGIQEILVIVLIIVVIVLAPRLLARIRHNDDESPYAAQPRFQLSRPLRVAVVLSAVWLAASAAYLQPWSSDSSLFLIVGISPVVLLWGAIWIKR